MSSTLESYELIRFAEAFEARLATAGEMLTSRPGLDPEKGWLTTALELVRTARAPTEGVLDRVKDLPELEEAREEYAFHQQGLWVDALEKLHAGITFTASSRAPVIEALFPHLKFPQLRRAPREAVLEYATSYERRTKSAYVTRIVARDDFALVRPVMEQVLVAHNAWRTSHEPGPLTLEQEGLLREELVSLGRKLEQSLRQARLLAEAALVPVPTVYEAAGLHLKPKRRAGRGLSLADDALAGFDDAGDSMEPTEAELAEVAALDAGGDVAPPAGTALGETTTAATASGDGRSPESAQQEAAGTASPAPAEASSEKGDGAATATEGVTGAEASATTSPEAAAPTTEGGAPSPQTETSASPRDSAVEAHDGAEAAPKAPASRAGRRGRKKAEAPEPVAPEAAPSPGEDGAPRASTKGDAGADDSSGTHAGTAQASHASPQGDAGADDRTGTRAGTAQASRASPQGDAEADGSTGTRAGTAQSSHASPQGDAGADDRTGTRAGEAQAPRVRKKKGASPSSSTTEST